MADEQESLPRRVWTSCTVTDEGQVTCQGIGDIEVHERFIVNANGVDTEVICISWEKCGGQPTKWQAEDLMSVMNVNRVVVEGHIRLDRS